MTNIETILQLGWEKRSAVPFSLTTCSYLARQYFDDFGLAYPVQYDHFLFVVRPTMATAYHVMEEEKTVGEYLAHVLETSPGNAEKWSDELKEMTDTVLDLANKDNDYLCQPEHFNLFEQTIGSYLPIYIRFVKAANYLTTIEKPLFQTMEQARMYAEPAYTAIDHAIRRIATSVCGVKPELSMYVLQRELREAVVHKILVDEVILQSRMPFCTVYADHGEVSVLDVKQTEAFEQGVACVDHAQTEVYGQSAVHGKVTGIVRLITNPKDVAQFNLGDILVTEMTRPEYIPFMKKAGAIVTDAGGVLSHAAIVSRELGIACIIGTKIATQVFKDGDMVEVDANKGVVRKI